MKSGDDDLWPAWAEQSIDVVDYVPAWADAGRAEGQRLQQLLDPWLSGPVEHIGSTAVPGLAAKPIIDLQAPVPELGIAEVVASTLAPYGWHYVDPDLDGRAHRRFYVKAAGDQRVAHLHLMLTGHPRLFEQRAFRDALVADPDLTRAYATLKIGLAREYRFDRETYTAAKADFVRSVLERGARAPGVRATTREHPERENGAPGR
jgi:GrpB-like predicted nucleotidyltransferase (UPF0157 family)